MRLLVAALVLLSSTAAAREPLCAPIQQVEKVLAEHNEKPVSVGEMESGNLLVIYASPAGTWTAIVIAPNGIACVGPIGLRFRLVNRGA